MVYNLRRDLGFYGGHGDRHVRELVTLFPQLGSKELTENRAWLSNVREAPAPVSSSNPNSLNSTVF